MAYTSKQQLQDFLHLWLTKHGESNAKIVSQKNNLVAEVRGGKIICNTETRALSYVFQDIILDGATYRTETSVCSYGYLPVGQSAGVEVAV